MGKYLLLLGLCSIFILPAPTQAQGTDFTGVEIVLSPENPKPNEKVTARIRSFGTQINNAIIVWYVNEVPKSQGIGNTIFEFTAGTAGSNLLLEVAIISNEQTVARESVTVRPVNLDILWEANTYTPPWYKGRPLYSVGSTITVSAIHQFLKPGGALYDTQELLYTWKRNNTVLREVNGRGKSAITIDGPQLLGSDIISVTVASIDGEARGTASVLIPTTAQKIVLYAEDALQGILYNAAIGSKSVQNISELTIAAIPYFFDVGSVRDPLLAYLWTVNGDRITVDSKEQFHIILGAPSASDITATISLTITHIERILQEATRTWVFDFKERGGVFFEQ